MDRTGSEGDIPLGLHLPKKGSANRRRCKTERGETAATPPCATCRVIRSLALAGGLGILLVLQIAGLLPASSDGDPPAWLMAVAVILLVLNIAGRLRHLQRLWRR